MATDDTPIEVNQLDWKVAAKEAVKNGYQPRNNWELMLERHLRSYLPDLVTELESQGDFQAYLQVQTNHAMQECLALEDQGMDPLNAQESAMQTLLPIPPDEIDRPEGWELEAGQSEATDAMMRLLSKRNPNNP